MADSGFLALALARAARDDYPAWLAQAAAVGGCSQPVRLRGQIHHVDPATGEVLRTSNTSDLPDGVIYTACGDRRPSVCPACAETYCADTYQLIPAGLVGGKGISESVVSVVGDPTDRGRSRARRLKPGPAATTLEIAWLRDN